MKKNNLLKVMLSILLLTSVTFLIAGGPKEEVTVKEKTIIKFANVWWLEPGRKELWTEFSNKFEQEFPEYKIEPVAVPYKEYLNKMKILLASDPPDLFYVQQIHFKLWKDQGYLEPLNKYFEFNNMMNEFSVPEAQKSAEIDGKMYGLYLEACPYGGLIYNKKLFHDAGISKLPKTPEEFLSIAQKLTNVPEQYGFITANTPDNPVYMMQHAMITIEGFGGRIMKENGKFGVNSPEFIEGVRFYKKLYDSGVEPKAMDYTTQRKLFFAGKAAMCMDGGYFIPWTASENPEVGKYLDVAPTPYPNKTNPIDLTYFAISSKSSPEKKKGAAEFLKFYMRPEIQAAWIESCGYPVTMKSAATTEYRNKYPWYQIYEKVAAYGNPLSIPGYELQSEEIRKIVSDHIGKVLVLNESPEKAMNDAQIEIEKLVGLKK